MARFYAVRFLWKFLHEVEGFLTSQQLIPAILLALLAALYQNGAGRLSLDALKENVAAVLFPFVWLIFGYGCFYSIKAAFHLHRDQVAEARAYRPAIEGYRPKFPSPVSGVLSATLVITILGLSSYLLFRAAFPSPLSKIAGVEPPPEPAPPPAESNPPETALPSEPVATNPSAPNRPPSVPEPELVLVAPRVTHVFSWVPEIDIHPRITPSGRSGYPSLELQNLSGAPIVAIDTSWSVPGPSVESLFTSSRRFSKYSPLVAGTMFWMTNTAKKGAGFPTADAFSLSFPSVGADPLVIDIPPAVWNGFAIKFIASQERPEPGSDVARGLLRTTVTVAHLRLRYRQGRDVYTRRFRVDAMVFVAADDAFLGGEGIVNSIPREYWSADNLRANLRFSSVQY